MDGLAKENPDDLSCTAVYRCFNSVFKSFFALRLGHHSAFFFFFAKLHVIILSVGVVLCNDWLSTTLLCLTNQEYNPS